MFPFQSSTLKRISFFLQTPFVRQNTPHPKELKAKAHKLFAKGSKQSSMEESDLEKSHSSAKEENTVQTSSQPPAQNQEEEEEDEIVEVSNKIRNVSLIF